MEWQWSLAELQTRGYTFKSPFHEGACNQNGGWVSILIWDHAKTCSLCEYVWETEAESHDLWGEVTYDEEDHYYHCSVCGLVSSSGPHTFEYYGTCNECGYEAYP